MQFKKSDKETEFVVGTIKITNINFQIATRH